MKETEVAEKLSKMKGAVELTLHGLFLRALSIIPKVVAENQEKPYEHSRERQRIAGEPLPYGFETL